MRNEERHGGGGGQQFSTLSNTAPPTPDRLYNTTQHCIASILHTLYQPCKTQHLTANANYSPGSNSITVTERLTWKRGNKDRGRQSAMERVYETQREGERGRSVLSVHTTH